MLDTNLLNPKLIAPASSKNATAPPSTVDDTISSNTTTHPHTKDQATPSPANANSDAHPATTNDTAAGTP